MKSNKPILFMAGGTGGHVFPALAIANALKKQAIPVAWLGTQHGMEARIVPDADIPIHYINIKGLRGKSKLSLLLAPFKIIWAIGQSIRILRQVKPAAVVGMGGFASGPGGVAAWLLGIPVFIHEQNAIAGLTNRLLARFATQVMQAFPNTFPEKCQAIYTGNPLRADILQTTPKADFLADQTLHILILGGSLGAKALNETLPQALQKVTGKIEVLHQAGEKHITTMQQTYANAQFEVKVTAFIKNMADAYQWADLVICRAGALTVSEIAQIGVASLLIPFPFAVDDHQTENAKLLSDNNAAILLPQAKLQEKEVIALIEDFIQHPEKLATMAKSAKQCAKPEALNQIVNIILTRITD